MPALLRLRLMPLLLLALAGCKKDDPGSSTPDPSGPILDAAGTGWERVASIPVLAEVHSAFTLQDLQLSSGGLVALYAQRTISSPYPDLQNLYKASLAQGAATVYRLPALNPADYTCFFKPNSFKAFGWTARYFNRTATPAVVPETGPTQNVATEPYLLFDALGAYESGYYLDAAGTRVDHISVPEVFEDEAVLYSGGGTSRVTNNISFFINSVQQLHYYKNGKWVQAVGGASVSSNATVPPAGFTSVFRAVRLASGQLHGISLNYNGVSILDTTARPNRNSTAGMAVVASSAFANFPPQNSLMTKVVGNTVLFASWSGQGTSNAPYTVNTYRWREGSTTIERLVTNVAVPVSINIAPASVAPVRGNGIGQLDDNGNLFFLGAVDAAGSVALVRVDPSGVSQASRPFALENGFLLGALRLINGQWHMGVGPAIGNTHATAHLDIVRLRP